MLVERTAVSLGALQVLAHSRRDSVEHCRSKMRDGKRVIEARSFVKRLRGITERAVANRLQTASVGPRGFGAFCARARNWLSIARRPQSRAVATRCTEHHDQNREGDESDSAER